MTEAMGVAGDATGKTVLVVGASFAGLATAWWMRRLGYAVTVVEVARGLRKGGTPVDIREGVVEVVRRMGLLERIVAKSLPKRSMVFVGGDGRPVATRTERPGDAREAEYEIERDDLLDMLFEEVKEDVEFRFGESVAAMEQTAEEVVVRFTSGEQGRFALVAGCDGTHSAVRGMCFGDERAYSVFLQNYFSLTIVDKLLLPEDTSQMFNVPGKTVMLNAYHGKTDIGLCFRSDEEVPYERRDREQQKGMIRAQFAGEGWRVAELVDEMSRSEDFYFDKLCQVRMDAWSKGRVVLVGDAAYCPSPAAGMGGSMAILGAAALAEAMEKHPGDLPGAFAAYDSSFRPTVEAIQTEAVEVGLAMFMPRSEEEIERRNAWLNGE